MFASVFEAVLASEQTKTTEYVVTMKMEFCTLEKVQETIVDPLIEGTRVQDPGIIEVLAFFPAWAEFYQT